MVDCRSSTQYGSKVALGEYLGTIHFLRRPDTKMMATRVIPPFLLCTGSTVLFMELLMALTNTVHTSAML